MNVFEAHLIALAESMAEQLISHLLVHFENQLGLKLPVPEAAKIPASIKS